VIGAADATPGSDATAFVERFRAAWTNPTLDGHEQLWAHDVVLSQPLMGRVVGHAACRQAFASLFRLIPDLHATVHRWGGDDAELFIEITLAGSFGGRPISWQATDRFLLRDGLIAQRRSYFDSAPLVLAMLRRPRGWPRLLRSGFRPRLGA